MFNFVLLRKYVLNKYNAIGIVFLFLFSVACYRDPGFPTTPTITYKSIALIKSTTTQAIEIKLNFTDGDGDIGLAAGDTLSPFNSNKMYDSLLAEIVETNPNVFNYKVTFLFKNLDSTFKSCDDSPDICSEETGKRLALLQGRFEDLNPERKARPISGELTYNIPSAGLLSILGGKTIKLKIFIQDRSLNKSNTIETDSLLIQ